MKTPLKATLISAAIVIVMVIAALIIATINRPTAPDPSETAGALPGALANSHVLDDAGPDAPTLVDFLDFECEVCGALYPDVEQLRKD